MDLPKIEEIKSEFSSLSRLYYDNRVLVGLVDTILESLEIDYKGYPAIKDDERITTYIKTFYPDELNNRLEELRREDNE